MNEQRKKTILLVEDEALIAMNEAAVLKKHGFEVLTAYNAEQAVKTAREKGIDLVLMDIDLGKGKQDGTEAAETILQSKDIPIVFLSSHTESDVVEKTENITSYGYVVKDSGDTVLLTSIKMAFRLHESRMHLKEEKNQNELRAKLLEAVEQAVIATDLDGTITYWNRYAEKLYGWTEEETIGINIARITVPEVSQEQADQIMTNLSRGERWFGEFLVQDKRGRRFFAHVTNSPVLDEQGNLIGIIGLSYDIDKQKKTEEERDSLISELQERVKELNCLYRFSSLVERSDTLEQIFEGLSGFIPPAWQYPEITSAKITYENSTYTSESFIESRWVQSSDIVVHGETRGAVEVFYAEEKPNAYEGPFLKEERELLDLIAERLGRIIERFDVQQRVEEQRAAIIKGERQFTSVVENMPVMMDAFDENNNILFWNKECERLTGYSAEEMLHTEDPMELLYPDTEYREVVFRELAERGGNFRGLELELTCKDGSKRTVSWYNIAELVPIEGWATWAVGIDITEQKRAEEKLRASEELHRITLTSIGDAVISTDTRGRVITMNEVAQTLTGYNENEARYRPLEEVFTVVHSKTEEPLENPVEKVLSTGEVIAMSNHTRLVSSKGSAFQVADTAAPIRDDSGNIHGVVLVFRDETKKYEQQEKLRESEERYRLLLESITDSVFVLDSEWRHVIVNEAGSRFTGLSINELLGSRLTDLFPGIESTDFFRTFERVRRSGIASSVESSFRFPDGREGWYEIHVYPVPEGILCISRDITDRKASDEEIKKLLDEKDMLLHETHHRVKNNMNIIASLLSLQADNVQNTEAEKGLLDARNRIMSMQKLYDHLFCSEEYSNINLGTYLGDLLQEVAHTYATDQFTIYSKLEDLSIGVKTAVPVGILINEIVANAIKYAFPGERKGSIGIEMNRDKSGQVILSIEDDGVGLPEDPKMNDDGFGFGLIHTLVEQIEGEIDIIRNVGTKFIISFTP